MGLRLIKSGCFYFTDTFLKLKTIYMKKEMNFQFTEGIGGGNQPSYLLLLNGGICKGYPKTKFSLEKAKELADIEVNNTIEYFGQKGVTYTKTAN